VDPQRADQLGLVLDDEDAARCFPGHQSQPADFADSWSSAMFSSSTFTDGSPRMPSVRPWVYFDTSARTADTGRCRAAATRLTWMAAFCGEMPGSRPEADAVTASGGICDAGTWSNAAMAFCRCAISLTRSGLFGPRLEAAENSGLQP